jgi:porphyrinogen peroxidase
MNQTPQLDQQRDDIQAILASGLGLLKSSRFYLLTIEDASLAKRWLTELVATSLVKTVKDLSNNSKNEKNRPHELCTIAFSFSGLKELGIHESDEFPFPTPFRSGMGSEIRERLLRDSPRSQWNWSDVSRQEQRSTVHILLGHWWDDVILKDLEKSSVPKFPEKAFTFRIIDGSPGFFRNEKLYEPFGFRDGISQPVLDGLKAVKTDVSNATKKATSADKEKSKLSQDHVIAAGEVILGYRNEYNELSYCADVQGWRKNDATKSRAFTFNGSYIAVRQIEQHVDVFEKFKQRSLGAKACPANVTVAEKLMGRRLDDYGTPLGWTEKTCPMSDAGANLFRYRVQDANGFATPLGSHIRRSNPRDTLGHDVESGVFSSKLHRLLRRGRPYRETVDGRETQGIFFIACNADLERQFEFVYQRWIRNPRFNGLDSQDDPLLGAKSEGNSEGKIMTIQGLPSGTSIELEQFTTTLGGGYFFLPGIKALAFIAQ